MSTPAPVVSNFPLQVESWYHTQLGDAGDDVRLKPSGAPRLVSFIAQTSLVPLPCAAVVGPLAVKLNRGNGKPRTVLTTRVLSALRRGVGVCRATSDALRLLAIAAAVAVSTSVAIINATTVSTRVTPSSPTGWRLVTGRGPRIASSSAIWPATLTIDARARPIGSPDKGATR